MTEPIAETNAALTAAGTMFEMETVDIRGVPTRVWKNAPAVAPGHPGAQPRLHGDGRSSSTRTSAITFDEHFRLAPTFAHRLIDTTA